MLDGLFLIDKEPDYTSHDVVQEVRRIVRQRKIGHCGTLDPAATGLLVATAGKATRLTRFLIRAPKVYTGTIRFGIVTDTYDSRGQVVAEHSVEALDRQAVDRVMTRLVGTFEQVAPPFSAKKHKGVKYYEMARRGEEVPEASKNVTVYEFRPTDELRDGCLQFSLSCSSGTYVRSLAHDLGRSLGCGAHLAELRRLQVGPFKVEDAVTLEALRASLESEVFPTVGWIPLDEIPLPFGVQTVDHQQEQRLAHGQTVLVRDLDAEAGDWVRLVSRRGRLVAVGTIAERIGQAGVGVVQPRIVFE